MEREGYEMLTCIRNICITKERVKRLIFRHFIHHVQGLYVGDTSRCD